MENNNSAVKKTGINLLRLIVLVCCIVSFRNTAFGLKEYIFKENVWIAYAVSLVFQGIVAVISLQYRKIMRSYKRRCYDPPKNTNEKVKNIRIKWINLVSFIAFTAFFMSIFFDYVYVVNSTYKITKADDQKADIAEPFADIRSEIFEWLTPAMLSFHEDVESSVEAVFKNTGEVGSGYVKEWDEYWREERAKYDTAALEPLMNYAVPDVAGAYGDHRNGNNERAIMTAAQINDFKNAYGKYDVNKYVIKAIDSATLMEPRSLGAASIKRITDCMEEIKEHIFGLVQLEKQVEGYKDNTLYAGNEDIFALLKAQEEAKAEEIGNVNSWEYQLAKGTAVLYEELSQLRINQCKEAIADINEYLLYIESITEDARYNASLILAELSEFKETDTKETDAITAKIGQAVFAQTDSDDPELKEKIANFQNLRSAVSHYVPLKNIDYIIRSFQLEENDFDEKSAKKQIDNLVQWLSSLAQSSASDGTVIDKEKVSSSIHKLITLEDVYLNEKNPLIEALNHLMTDRNTRYYKAVGEERAYSPSHSTVLLAVIALAFAALVDLTSLFLGNVVQKWEEE